MSALEYLLFIMQSWVFFFLQNRIDAMTNIARFLELWRAEAFTNKFYWKKRTSVILENKLRKQQKNGLKKRLNP